MAYDDPPDYYDEDEWHYYRSLGFVMAKWLNKVEDTNFEIDGGYGKDSTQSRGFLTLEGDFTRACERRLTDDAQTSITFSMDLTTAEELYHKLRNYFSGY